MRHLHTMWRFGRIAICVLAAWLVMYGISLAANQPGQPPKVAGEEVQSSTYVLAYFLTILGVASGVLFVCRPAGRRDRARPELYGEAKTVTK